jgi:hypothetical protein
MPPTPSTLRDRRRAGTRSASQVSQVSRGSEGSTEPRIEAIELTASTIDQLTRLQPAQGRDPGRRRVSLLDTGENERALQRFPHGVDEVKDPLAGRGEREPDFRSGDNAVGTANTRRSRISSASRPPRVGGRFDGNSRLARSTCARPAELIGRSVSPRRALLEGHEVGAVGALRLHDRMRDRHDFARLEGIGDALRTRILRGQLVNVDLDESA